MESIYLSIYLYSHTDTQTHRHTDTHTDTQTHIHTGTQTHRHTDTQTPNGKMDRQAETDAGERT